MDGSTVKEGEHINRWLIRPWNSQSHLDFGIAFIKPDQYMRKHVHVNVEEIFYVIEGKIVLLLNKKKNYILNEGYVAYIPHKQIHALYNRSNKVAILVVVKSPSLPSDKM